MNILCNYEYHAPKTKAEALELLHDVGDKAKILAGGTDLVIMLKEKMIAPEHVINIADIEELKGINFTADGVEIGAGTKISIIGASKELDKDYHSLCFSADQLGSYQVRTMATIGGNIAHALPAGETHTPLVALNAEVILESKKGERKVKVEDFILGNRQNVLESDEMITKVFIPKPKAHSRSEYGHIGLRNSMEIDCAIMTVNIALEDDKKTIKDVKMVMGSVAPKPLISEKAPKILIGKELNDDLIQELVEAAQSEAKPITDIRATAEYRRDVIGALAKNLTKKAYQLAMEV